MSGPQADLEPEPEPEPGACLPSSGSGGVFPLVMRVQVGLVALRLPSQLRLLPLVTSSLRLATVRGYSLRPLLK